MKTDALSRRLRFADPSPLVRRLVLTDADILIFEAIHRHGPLPSNYLYEFTKHLRKDQSHLQNRLTEFYNGDAVGPYLTRPQQQFAGFEARYQHMVYDLAPRAKAFVNTRRSTKRTDPFLHQLMGACVGASIELGSVQKGLRYIPREEIFSHPKCGDARNAIHPMAIPVSGVAQKALIPDDLFGLEYPGAGFRFFAVEIDRNTESIERKNMEQNAFGRKIACYLDVLRNQLFRSWWGLPNLSVLTVTTNAIHAANILDFIRKQDEKRYQDRFAFAVATDFGANWRVPRTVLSGLLDEPWMTSIGNKDIAKP